MLVCRVVSQKKRKKKPQKAVTSRDNRKSVWVRDSKEKQELEKKVENVRIRINLFIGFSYLPDKCFQCSLLQASKFYRAFYECLLRFFDSLLNMHYLFKQYELSLTSVGPEGFIAAVEVMMMMVTAGSCYVYEGVNNM